jgi:hypothetical protein
MWRSSLFSLLIRFGLCAAVTYYAFKQMGEYGVVSVVIWGALLAKPIMDLFIATHQSAKAAAMRGLQGRHYAFHDMTIRVLIIREQAWIVDEDLLRVINQIPDAISRRRAHPQDYRELIEEKCWAYSEQGAYKLLKQSRHRDAAKLRLWLAREVYLPIHTKQERGLLH